MLPSPQGNHAVNRIVLKPLVLAIHISLVSAVTLSTTQAYANTAVQHYQIQPTTLRQALSAFALQAGVNISMNSDQLQNIPSQGLSGQYSLEQGFAELLKNTNLRIQKSGNGYVLVEKVKVQQPQTRDMGPLNTINVAATGTATRDSNAMQLPVITVIADQDGSSEDGYLTKNITGIGVWDKRSLQDTPYQMAVISKDLIENTASGIEQIFKMNPTTQVSYTPTSAQSWGSIGMNIRGFSVVDNTILNGIPIPSTYTSLGQNLERIEILNGLSGFLYGIGNVGGSVNYVTKKPTQDRLTNLTIGSTGNQTFYGHLDLGGKIDREGKFAYRLNAFKQEGETSINNQKVDNTLISGALDWNVTDDLIVSFDASHKANRTDKLVASFSSSSTAGKLDPKQGYSPDWTFSDSSQDRLGFNSVWQINDNIKVRTGYIYLEKESEHNQPYVYDNYDGTYRFNYYRLYPSNVKDHGAYIYSDFDFNTFGVQHTLTLGSSGNKRKAYSTDTAREWVSLGNYHLDQLNSVLEPKYLGSSNDPMYLSSHNQKINFMIGDDIQFNDQWSALLGLNYAKTKTKSYNTVGAKTNGYDADKVTPNISIIFKPIESLTTYATYIESLENGVIVGDDYKNAGELFEPYVSKQYELGAKYSISDSLLLSSALFRIQKANSYEDFSTTPKSLSQDGQIIHQGLELTVTGKLTDHLTLVAGGTIMNLEIDKANANEGKEPANTASKMAKLYTEYTIPTLEGLTVTGGASYKGESYRDGANTDIIPAYTVFDAGLRYKTSFGQSPTTFILNATNLTNKKYWRSPTSFGEPRNIAFAIKTEF